MAKAKPQPKPIPDGGSYLLDEATGEWIPILPVVTPAEPAPAPEPDHDAADS
jgi:hypothetical protein